MINNTPTTKPMRHAFSILAMLTGLAAYGGVQLVHNLHYGNAEVQREYMPPIEAASVILTRDIDSAKESQKQAFYATAYNGGK